jgi:hypothetical protein
MPLLHVLKNKTEKYFYLPMLFRQIAFVIVGGYEE